MAPRPRTTATSSAHVGSRAGLVELSRAGTLQPSTSSSALGAVQPKRHEVLGLVTLSAGTLLGLALASYDARGGRDWCGPIGAQVAESLVALAGAASVLLAWSLGVISVRLFRRNSRPLRFWRTLGSAGVVVAIATALHLSFGDQPALGHLPAGGLIGSTLGEGLRSVIGTAGAHVVTLTALLVALVVRTRLSVVTFARSARTASVKSSVVARDGIVTVARAWRQAREEDVRARGETLEAGRLVAAEERTESALADVFASAHDERLIGDEDLETGGVGGAADTDPGGPATSLAALLGADSPEVDVAPRPAPKPRRPRRAAAPSRVDGPEAPEVPMGEVSFAAPALVPASHAESEPDAAPDVVPVVAPRASRRAPRVASVRPPAPEPVAETAEAIQFVTTPALERAAAPARPIPTAVARPPRPLPPRPATPEPEPVLEDAVLEVDDVDEPTPGAHPSPPEAFQIVSHDEEIAAAMRAPIPDGAAPPPPRPAPLAVRGPIEFPPSTLLTAAPRDGVSFDENQLRAAADRLLKTLKDYTIDGRVVEIHPGPVVTTYEFVPAAGTKLAKIARLGDDIAMSLEANKVRIVAPIPGKGRVGFEIPNIKRQTVYFREMIETEAFQSLGGAMPVAFGKDVVGAPFFADLATMPHLIVAGATGAGKSVGLNVMLTSLLYKRGPEDVRLLMIDPKMVELAVYDGIPHMLLPVVTDMKKASLALRWVVDEMERRYTLFAQTGSRNITTFNERVAKALAEGKTLKGLTGPVRTKVTGTTVEVAGEGEGADDAPEAPQPTKLPYILVVVDEFADLMMVAGKEVEAAVARLAQKARAAGIHVILATQRPSVDVITGVIKANFPSRVAFKVSQKVDSRTILDQQGAEHLLGRGDMLILPPGSSDLRRVHCAFVSEDEVQAVTDHWRKQGTPTYDEDILRPREEEGEADGDEPEIRVPMEKYEKAVALVLSSRRCSVSWVQRQLAIGYNVAARMVEKMERDGIVSPPKGPGKDREVLG